MRIDAPVNLAGQASDFVESQRDEAKNPRATWH
jgi:hypothetical protein